MAIETLNENIGIKFSKNSLVFGNLDGVTEFDVINNVDTFKDTTSFLYDGVDDYQDASSWSTIDGSSGFTISMWIKLTSMTNYTRLLSGYETGTSVNLYMNVNPNGMMEVWSGGSSSNWSRSVIGAITLNTWHNVVMRLDEPSVSRYLRQRIFIDGVVNHSSSNYYGGTIPNGTTLGVGANPNNTNPIYLYPTTGNINELAIWGSDILTDAQIQNDIYNGGSATNLSALSTPPTNWYRSENAIWQGSYYTTSDEMGNGAKLLTRNMSEASIVNDVP
jgi:hypothetical protein